MTAYLVSPLARADLDEIWDYVAKDSPAAADRLLARFQEKFLLLAKQPLLGQTREELRAGIRSFVVGNYVIYYQLVNDRIRVVRVLHGSRDVGALLSDSNE